MRIPSSSKKSRFAICNYRRRIARRREKDVIELRKLQSERIVRVERPRIPTQQNQKMPKPAVNEFVFFKHANRARNGAIRPRLRFFDLAVDFHLIHGQKLPYVRVIALGQSRHWPEVNGLAFI